MKLLEFLVSQDLCLLSLLVFSVLSLCVLSHFQNGFHYFTNWSLIRTSYFLIFDSSIVNHYYFYFRDYLKNFQLHKFPRSLLNHFLGRINQDSSRNLDHLMELGQYYKIYCDSFYVDVFTGVDSYFRHPLLYLVQTSFLVN